MAAKDEKNGKENIKLRGRQQNWLKYALNSTQPDLSPGILVQ